MLLFYISLKINETLAEKLLKLDFKLTTKDCTEKKKNLKWMNMQNIQNIQKQ